MASLVLLRNSLSKASKSACCCSLQLSWQAGGSDFRQPKIYAFIPDSAPYTSSSPTQNHTSILRGSPSLRLRGCGGGASAGISGALFVSGICLTGRALLYQLLPPCSSVEGALSEISHMCPKDFTIDCIINTVLPAPLSLCAKDGDLAGLEINRSTGLQSRKLKR